MTTNQATTSSGQRRWPAPPRRRPGRAARPAPATPRSRWPRRRRPRRPGPRRPRALEAAAAATATTSPPRPAPLPVALGQAQDTLGVLDVGVVAEAGQLDRAGVEAAQLLDGHQPVR